MEDFPLAKLAYDKKMLNSDKTQGTISERVRERVRGIQKGVDGVK